MMRKLAVTLALASTALSTPALARDGSWYVGVEGGAMVVENIQYDISTPPGATGEMKHHYGWDVDGHVGYDLGHFRLEAEVGYRRANAEQYFSTTSTPYYIGGTAMSAPQGTYSPVGGNTSALSFMVNGMADFGPDDGLSGFVGGGVGVARVKASNYAVYNTTPFLDDSDTVFAWQVIAGLRAPLNDHVDVTLKYRFFTADKVKLVDVAGRQFEGRFRSHSLLGGLTYNFGAPTPPPPPPPVAPPPPPPAPAPAPAPEPAPPVCTPGPYIVFFEWDKSDITPEAASILDNAISAYQNCGNAQVTLAGNADRSGPASYNIGLSQRRADSVKAYMVARGIPDSVITTEAFGESRPRVATADGVRELQNRNVQITYGPGSGM